MGLFRYIFATVVTCIILFMVSLLAAQNQVTLNPSKDNTLYQSANGSLSNGAGRHCFVGKTNGGSIRRALVAFDLSTIPPGATIQTVTLTMNVTKEPSPVTTSSVAIHKVIADWGEGASNAGNTNDGNGGASATNDATWLHRFFNTLTWTNQGGDFQGTASAATSVSGNGQYTWGSTQQMVADVQSWLDNSVTNFGWILIGNEGQNRTAKQFETREGSNKPLLTVTFSSPTSVRDNQEQPVEFRLAQNYPNPFNPSTVITYSIPLSGNVNHTTLQIFNVLGEKIRTLISTNQPAGNYQVQWDGRNDAGQVLANGVYVYRLQSGQFADSKKMLLVK